MIHNSNLCTMHVGMLRVCARVRCAPCTRTTQPHAYINTSVHGQFNGSTVVSL
jgi:hypothetical protein